MKRSYAHLRSDLSTLGAGRLAKPARDVSIGVNVGIKVQSLSALGSSDAKLVHLSSLLLSCSSHPPSYAGQNDTATREAHGNTK